MDLGICPRRNYRRDHPDHARQRVIIGVSPPSVKTVTDLELEHLRATVTAWAADKPDVDSAWLVGSHAWGELELDSDVDIYIRAPADAYAVGTIYDGWDHSLALATRFANLRLLSDAVPFHLKGRDPERDGVLLYKRPGRKDR